MVKTTVNYLGDLRCSLTHGPSGTMIETDAPVDNHGKGEKFSPTDLVAAALGACISTVLGILANRKQWQFSGMRVEVEKEMSVDAPRRIISLAVNVFMPIALNESDRALVENAAHACPVFHSINPAIKALVVFHWPL